MDYKNLMGDDCGGVNPLVQFAQLTIQDVAHQDSVGLPSTSSELAQGDESPPRYFRMQDIIDEMKAIDTEKRRTPAINSQSTQETRDSSKKEDSWNIDLPGSLAFDPTFNSFDQHSRKYLRTLRNQYEMTVGSLDELDDIDQREEQINVTLKSEVQQDTDPNPELKGWWKGIPIYNEDEFNEMLRNKTEAYTFMTFLRSFGQKCCDHDWEPKNPFEFLMGQIRYSEQEKKLRRNKILQHGDDDEYPHIKNNPMKSSCNPITYTLRKSTIGSMKHAIFFADEVARRFPANISRWRRLYNVYHNQLKRYDSFFVSKQILRMKPGDTIAHRNIIGIYLKHNCYFKAFETIVHWLKNQEAYADIPLNFAMEENSSGQDENVQAWIDSNRHIIDGVNKMLLEAVRRNPTDVESTNQSFLLFIFYVINKFHKNAECLTIISRTKETHLRTPRASYNLALKLFYSDDPSEALEELLISIENSDGKVLLLMFELIGIINMYTGDFREAIDWFKEALHIDSSVKRYACRTEGDLVEAEINLCLLLYFKLYKKIISK